MSLYLRRLEAEEICEAYGMTLRHVRWHIMSKQDAKIIREFLEDEDDIYMD